MEPEGGNVFSGGIPLMAGETVTGKTPVQPLHQPVAQYLCHDARRGNRGAKRIARYDGSLWEVKRKGLVSVNQEIIHRNRKAGDGGGHGAEGSAKYVYPFNLPGTGRGDGNRPGAPADNIEKLTSPPRGKFFAVVQSLDGMIRVEDNGRRQDGARQGTAARLIDSCDGPAAFFP